MNEDIISMEYLKYTPATCCAEKYYVVHVQQKEAEAEGLRGGARELAGQRADLFAEARAAEEAAISARQRIPELEAQKRAAAAARVNSEVHISKHT